MTFPSHSTPIIITEGLGVQVEENYQVREKAQKENTKDHQRKWGLKWQAKHPWILRANGVYGFPVSPRDSPHCMAPMLFYDLRIPMPYLFVIHPFSTIMRNNTGGRITSHSPSSRVNTTTVDHLLIRTVLQPEVWLVPLSGQESFVVLQIVKNWVGILCSHSSNWWRLCHGTIGSWYHIFQSPYHTVLSSHHSLNSSCPWPLAQARF